MNRWFCNRFRLHEWDQWYKIEHNKQRRKCSKCGFTVDKVIPGWWRG